MPNEFRFVSHDAIDKEKWDRRITEAPNGLIYAYSWYLDAMSSQWNALIKGDYEWVMPLSARKKWGIKYLYQPPFVAQGGLFGSGLNAGMMEEAINAIPDRYRLVEISLNEGNALVPASESIRFHANYLLPLQDDYEVIREGYRKNTRRELNQASKLEFKTDIPLTRLVELGMARMSPRTRLTKKDFEAFTNLFETAAAKGMAKSFGVYQDNRLLSSAACFSSHQRLYYVLAGNEESSRETHASHFLIDRIIRLYAGTNLTFDFEGSNLPGIAFFFENFGASRTIYPVIRRYNLPWWVKLFKKTL